ncbi:MAG: hypothetical protein KKA84_04180 [Bacteroidetes bacterium]|nr:hypothetical protein [Bacteroidota bacterium]
MKKSFILFLILVSSVLFAQDYKVGDHELLLMPTAYTMPVNTSYFTDYEVLLLNYTYALTPTTHLGAFTIFPFRKDFYETLSIGVKQNYYRGEVFQLAAYLSYTPEGSFFILGNVISIGQAAHGFHASLAYTTSVRTDARAFLYMLGYRIDPSENTSLILEYSNGQNAERGIEGNGLLSLGFRMRSEYISWELGGMRNFDDDSDWFLYPLLKATYYFH